MSTTMVLIGIIIVLIGFAVFVRNSDKIEEYCNRKLDE